MKRADDPTQSDPGLQPGGPISLNSALLAAQQTHAHRAMWRLHALHASVCLLLGCGAGLLSALLWQVLAAPIPLPGYALAAVTLSVAALVALPGWRLGSISREMLPGLLRRLGAQPPDTLGDVSHRRLQNLVEERALAACVAVPAAFVLDAGELIDAFTLGAERQHTYIVVTRAALMRLDRDELDALITHEIAHVVLGDTALATRLIVLNRSLRRAGSLGRAMGAMPDSPWAMRLLGQALVVLGAPASACARLVEAGLSMQRDIEADAWVVELTGRRDSLARALRKACCVDSPSGSTPDEDRAERTFMPQADWFDLGVARFTAPVGWAQGSASNLPVSERLHRLCGPGSAAPLNAGEPKGTGVVALPLHKDLQADAGRAHPPAVVVPDEGEPRWWDEEPGLPAGAGSSTAVMRLMRATREPAGAAALAVALMATPARRHVADGTADRVGLSPAPDWGRAWLVAAQRYTGICRSLQELSAETLQALRWPLMELSAARLRPLPGPARQALVDLARRQAEHVAESAPQHAMHFVLLQRRLAATAPRERRTAETLDARSVRVLFAALAQQAQVSEPRADRAANAAIRELGLPPIGGNAGRLSLEGLERAADQAAGLPMLDRSLLVAHLSRLLPAVPSAPCTEFMRLLCLSIDCPYPGDTASPDQTDRAFCAPSTASQSAPAAQAVSASGLPGH